MDSQNTSEVSLTEMIHLLEQYQKNRKSDLFHMNNIKKKAVSRF